MVRSWEEDLAAAEADQHHQPGAGQDDTGHQPRGEQDTELAEAARCPRSKPTGTTAATSYVLAESGWAGIPEIDEDAWVPALVGETVLEMTNPRKQRRRVRLVVRRTRLGRTVGGRDR